MIQSALSQAVEHSAFRSFKLDQKEFLTTNWKMLQANCEYYHGSIHKYAKVSRGIISISNGAVIVRCPAGLPDGHYVISEDNEFITTSVHESRWYKFPDYDAAMPNFKFLDYTPPINQEDVLTIIEYCNFLRKASTTSLSRVAIEGNLLVAQDLAESWLTLPHVIPVNIGSIVFDAYDLKLAFTEMLRYDSVQIGFDNTHPDNHTIIVGKDWGHCALITGR